MHSDKKNVVYFFGLNIISKAFSYFLLLVFANLYTPLDYGKSAFIFSMFNLVFFFSYLGLPDALVPWIIKKKDVSSIFYFLLIVTLIFTGIGALISISYPIILPFVILLPFLIFDPIGRAILQVKHKYHYIQFFSLIFVVITLMFAYLFRHLGAFGIIISYVLGYFIPLLLIFLLTYKEIINILSNVKLDYNVVKEYVKKGFTVMIIALSFAFLAWMGSSMLGLLSNFENVAKYSIINPLASIVIAVSLSMSMFLLTRSAELEDKAKSLDVLNKTVRISYTLSFLISFLINIFSFLIVKIFFPKYQGIEVYIAILSIGALFYVAYSLMSVYLIGNLNPEKTVSAIITAVLTSIILNLLLIPKYGLYGIVISMVISHLIAFTLLAKKLNLLKEFYGVYIMPVFLLLGFYMGYYGLILLIPLIGLLFYLNLIKKEDLLIMKSVIKSIIKYRGP